MQNESSSYHLTTHNNSPLENHLSGQIQPDLRRKSVTDVPRIIPEHDNNNGFLKPQLSSNNQMLKLDYRSDILTSSYASNSLVSSLPINKRNSASFFTANIIGSNNDTTQERRIEPVQENQFWFNTSQREPQNLQQSVNFFVLKKNF